MALVNGPLAPLPCVSLVMKQVRDAISDVLDGVTLSDLTKPKQSEQAAGGATYEI
jgi:hypothetical protein